MGALVIAPMKPPKFICSGPILSGKTIIIKREQKMRQEKERSSHRIRRYKSTFGDGKSIHGEAANLSDKRIMYIHEQTYKYIYLPKN